MLHMIIMIIIVNFMYTQRLLYYIMSGNDYGDDGTSNLCEHNWWLFFTLFASSQVDSMNIIIITSFFCGSLLHFDTHAWILSFFGYFG